MHRYVEYLATAISVSVQSNTYTIKIHHNVHTYISVMPGRRNITAVQQQQQWMYQHM